MGDRMRLDRDHLAVGADMTRQHQRVGADIGPDIDEHAAGGNMRAQKIQFLEIVVGIEQRAAFGGAGLVVEAERGALILHVDGACAQQIDQPRQHRPERAALQPRAVRHRNDRSLRGIRRECAERRGGGVVVGSEAVVLSERRMHSRFCGGETGSMCRVRFHRPSSPRRRGSSTPRLSRFNHCRLWNTGSPPSRG